MTAGCSPGPAVVGREAGHSARPVATYEVKPAPSPVVAWRRRALKALGPNDTVAVRAVAVLCGILGRDLSAQPTDAFLAAEMGVPLRSVSTAIARLAELELVTKRSLGRRGRVLTALLTDADRAEIVASPPEKLAGGPRTKRASQLAGGAHNNSLAASGHRRRGSTPLPPNIRDAARQELLAEMRGTRGGGGPPPASPEDERDFLRAIGDGDERLGRHRFLRLPKLERADWAARFSAGLTTGELDDLAHWANEASPNVEREDAA